MHSCERISLELIQSFGSLMSKSVLTPPSCRRPWCRSHGQRWWPWCSVCWCVWEHWRTPTPPNLKTPGKTLPRRNWPSTTPPWDTTSIWSPGSGMHTHPFVCFCISVFGTLSDIIRCCSRVGLDQGLYQCESCYLLLFNGIYILISFLHQCTVIFLMNRCISKTKLFQILWLE